MKTANTFNFARALVLSAVVLTGCGKGDDAKAPATEEKVKAPEKPGVMLDAETQQRIGLATELPVAAQWQPELPGHGWVVEPAALTAAAADLAAAQSAAGLSRKEWERQKTLAVDNNISVRALETAEAAATHDSLAVESARCTRTGI